MMAPCLLLILLVSLAQEIKLTSTAAATTATPTPAPSKCGYAACDAGRPDMLNIHLVPHGHCDTGWIKTVDQYYYGSRNNLQNKGIQYNIDGVVQGLREDPRRRFTWIEVAYFWRWWGEQSAAKQQAVRELVAKGQLMFGNNAWEMNDEASTHYQEIIDQHSIGERFLVETFGECGRPLAAWQIDTFGHSREFASLLAQMGHDALYFTRLDYEDKAHRMATKQMELMWSGSDEMGVRGNIFSGIFYNGYAPPPGFCYSCGDDPIMDDNRLFDYNKDAKIGAFLAAMQQWAKAYATNHVFVPMGSDFDYELANRWFVNEDKLIKYINALQAKGSKINVLYSTVPCYTWAIHSTNYTFPGKTDDFFPYASRAHTFWTGSFTSRPTCKGYVRDSNAFLQTCKQLSVIAGLSARPDVDAAIDKLRRGMAIDLNHGQLPGTQRQVVAYDNMLRLANGSAECLRVVDRALDSLMGSPSGQTRLCSLLNISMCEGLEASAHGAVPVVIYNPLSRAVNHWLRLPVSAPDVTVKDAAGRPLAADVMLVSNRTLAIPERNSTAKYEVLVNVSLPAMGFTTVTVDATAAGARPVSSSTPAGTSVAGIISIANEYLRLDFDVSTKLLSRITNLKSGLSTTANLDLRYYNAFVGDNSQNGQSSGAYIFRPAQQKPVQFSVIEMSVVRGSLVQEIRQNFSNWATLVTRLYAGSPYAEVEWTVGPIPFHAKIYGKEVIVNYQSDLATSGVVYTDSNGRQMLRRVRNFRPTWNFSNSEPVSGNYYPLNTAMFITNSRAQLTVLVDRAQGGASIRDGQMEVMVHRRLGKDDAFGVAQALNELGSDKKGLIARGRHWLLFDSAAASPALMRILTPQLQLRPTVLPRSGAAAKVAEFSALRASLPVNLQLLSLEGWTGGKVLLRLEQPFHAHEHPKWSLPVSVDLATLFARMKVTAAEEVTLAGATPVAELKRLKWRSAKGREGGRRPEPPRLPKLSVTLQPSEIRTFVVTLSYA